MRRRATDQRETERRQFVEEMGMLFQGSGMPRMAGRVLGWLLLCNPPHQTAGELARVLGASKGSISSSLRLLVRSGHVERFGLPGRRSAHFRIGPDSWFEHHRQHLSYLGAFRRLAERGLELLADEPPAVSERLRELYDLFTYLEREMPLLMQRLLEARNSREKQEHR